MLTQRLFSLRKMPISAFFCANSRRGAHQVAVDLRQLIDQSGGKIRRIVGLVNYCINTVAQVEFNRQIAGVQMIEHRAKVGAGRRRD